MIQENNRLYHENMRRCLHIMEEMQHTQIAPAAAATASTGAATAGVENGYTNMRMGGSPRSSSGSSSHSRGLSATQDTRRSPRFHRSNIYGGGSGSAGNGRRNSSPLFLVNTPNILRTILQTAIEFGGVTGAAATTAATGTTPPTEQQIANSTENLIYNSRDFGANESICPISLETFREGASIMRIRHCGHVFNSVCLRQWFQTRSVCPVCRHNILLDGESSSNARTAPSTAAAAAAAAAASFGTEENMETDADEGEEDTPTDDADESSNIQRNTLHFDNGDSEYEIDIIAPTQGSDINHYERDNGTSDLFMRLVNLLDISGVTTTNIGSTRRTTENGANVIDFLYELNIPLGNINNL